MANRSRAEKACISCKEKKTKCNDFRPCARCLIIQSDLCLQSPKSTLVNTKYYTTNLLTSGYLESLNAPVTLISSADGFEPAAIGRYGKDSIILAHYEKPTRTDGFLVSISAPLVILENPMKQGTVGP